jgi:ribonuclease BN (tRNA processing enzyme)
VSGSITALGTGDAFSSGGRGHTCWLIEDAAGLALVDAGGTVLAALRRAQIDPRRISVVHFTHLHGDHIAGWPFLLIDALYRSRRIEPLSVTGPPGTRGRLEALWAASYLDTSKKPLGFALQIEELRPGDSLEIAGRRVTAVAAVHQSPPHVALSLRIGDLAFTGDTAAHPGLADLVRGARVLIAECSELSGRPPKHLSWDDLRALLAEVPVPRALLGHLGDEARAAKAAIEEDARALGVELTVCDDGERFLY